MTAASLQALTYSELYLPYRYHMHATPTLFDRCLLFTVFAHARVAPAAPERLNDFREVTLLTGRRK